MASLNGMLSKYDLLRFFFEEHKLNANDIGANITIIST